MIISQTPLRISFVGGGTDLPSFYRNNNYGAVLSTSISSYLYVSIKKQNALFEEKFRLNYSETELVKKISEIKNPIIRECIRHTKIKDRLYISTIADVPSHTGLGSSSSFTVGLLKALYKFKGQTIDSANLAKEASMIEINKLKQSLGKQDHYAATYGGLNMFIFNDNEKVNIQKIKISKKNLKKFYSSILMFWTGITRSSEIILTNQNRKNNNPDNIKRLIQMRNQVPELKVLLESKNFSLEKIGRLISQGWNFKKGLSKLITNQKLDNVFGEVISMGAYGGKLLGAGGGGFLMFIAEPSKKTAIINKVESMGFKYYNFDFDSKGSNVREVY